jgi:hypothetical protein
MKAAFSAPVAAYALSALLALVGVSPIRAEVRSKSNEIIVLQPKDLPEAAQTPGNSAFLYSDNDDALTSTSNNSKALALPLLTSVTRARSSLSRLLR